MRREAAVKKVERLSVMIVNRLSMTALSCSRRLVIAMLIIVIIRLLLCRITYTYRDAKKPSLSIAARFTHRLHPTVVRTGKGASRW